MDGPEYVKDSANGDRIGVVQERFAGSVYLRPPGGGVEWATRPEALRHLSEAELVQARVLNTPSGRGAVSLYFAPEPVKHPGCAQCEWCDAQRQDARGRGDLSAVTDFNVELNNHPHTVPKLSRLPGAQGMAL